MRLVVRGQRFGDLGQPFIQLSGWTGIQSWHRTHHTVDALGDHQFGVADDEQRRANDGEWERSKCGRDF